MSKPITSLEPKELWSHFAEVNAVPRPSKKEERIIEFMMEFGKKLGLPTSKDETGNVIIRKPASKGMEDRQTVVLQSHLDMVHQKNANTKFDFNTQGIEMLVDGDWVKANGTTLGADNGIGVASIMTVLASSEIAHPAIEALFTIDEETGMTGALNLKAGVLKGKILLNLDTEDDKELTIGCAGGIDVTATGSYTLEAAPPNSTFYGIYVKGLTGGHSGMDIYKGRGNSNKIMNRVLLAAFEKFSFQIASIDGGSLRNAIPRESVAEIALEESKVNEFEIFIRKLSDEIEFEYKTTDPNFSVTAKPLEIKKRVLQKGFQVKFMKSLYACANGVYRMSPDIEHLVQTSNNLARVVVSEGEYSIQCLTRSSVDSEKMDLANTLRHTFELIGARVEFKGSYPGWIPNPSAPIIKIMNDLYKEMYKEGALVNACHAGLECGILGANYPGMQMISFGPNIHGAHSPDEKVQISSVQKFWNYFLETLKRIPKN
ncbi:MAG: aminoacyl-histidine dipeptidase [Bacteroidota bacterium]